MNIDRGRGVRRAASSVRRLALCAALAIASAAASGAGANAQAPAPPAAVSLGEEAVWTIEPSAATLQAGETRTFSSFVPEEHRDAIAWTATGGHVTGDGVYTAPSTPGHYIVRAIIAGGPLSASASVTVVPRQGTTTHPADRFVDSVGVNVHLHYNGTLYRENFDLVKQRLLELGVRHVRDILVDTAWQGYYDRHNALGEAGIKGVFVMQRPDMPAAVLRDYPSRMSSAFEAYEAPNELDRSRDAGWVGALRESLIRLQAVTRVPGLARFPIYGPSMAFTHRHAELGDVSQYFDQGNLHNYFAGRHPGTGGWGATDREYPSYTWHFRWVSQYFGGKPIVTTETGYFNGASAQDSIPPEIAAKYLPRLLLEQYRQGITRTYVYELADEPGKQGHGLLTEEGTPKPAFRAVQNLLRLLSDPGPPVTVRPLEYSLSGASGDVRHLSFQNRNGSYYLALWIERSGYDVAARREVIVPPQPVELALEGPMRLERVYRWQPDGSVVEAQAGGSGRLPVTVTDSLTLLELREASGQ